MASADGSTNSGQRGAKGLNITAPFKLDAFAYANELSESARRAGAANRLKFEGDRIIAENFDGVGLVQDITANLGVKMAGRRVLMLGAGERRVARCCLSCASNRPSWFSSIERCPKPWHWPKSLPAVVP